MKKLVKKSMRTYIALILTMVMLVGMIPIYAFALSDEVQDNKSNDESNVETTEPSEAEGQNSTEGQVTKLEITGNEAIVASGLQLFAEETTYTVTFNVDGKVQKALTVNANEKISLEEAGSPIKSNLDFMGWYEIDSDTPFDFTNTPITTNLDLYAKYEAFVIFFDAGAAVYEQKVTEGEKAEIPEEPARDGYEFIGWHSSTTGIFDFDTPIIGHLFLTAQFKRINDENGNEETDPILSYLNTDKEYVRVTALKTITLNDKHPAQCRSCNDHTFRINLDQPSLNDLDAVWYSVLNGRYTFEFFEFSCPCGTRTLFIKGSNTPTYKNGVADNANNIKLGDYDYDDVVTLYTVRFTTDLNKGTLSHNDVFTVANETEWADNWIPEVTSVKGFTHTGWYEKKLERFFEINGPFPEKVESHLVFEATYTEKPTITIKPRDEIKMYNGDWQESSGRYFAPELPVGFTLENVNIAGKAKDVGEAVELSVSNIDNIIIKNENKKDVTKDYVITTLYGELSIIAAPVTIEVDNAWKYEGADDPVFTGVVEGLIGDDTLEVTYYRTNLGEENSEDIGEYPGVLSAKFAEEKLNENYFIFKVTPGNFEIMIPKYTVTFVSGDESASEDVIINVDRGTVTETLVPVFTANKGWKFAGWNRKLEEYVTDNATYTAQWEKDESMWFTVKYDPGSQKDAFTVQEYGNLLVGSATPSFDEDDPGVNPEGHFGWTFAGWTPEWKDTVTKDITYVAQWVRTKGMWFTVMYLPGSQGTFRHQIYRNRLLGTDTPDFEGDITGNFGWTFVGWKPVVDVTVTHSVRYVAQWKKTEGMWFTVTYEPGDYGTFATQPHSNLLIGTATPKFVGTEDGKAGWTFADWDPEWKGTVTEDVTYVAQWDPNEDIELTVNYYIKDTTIPLVPSEIRGNLIMATSHTEKALVIDGYKVDFEEITIEELAATGNEITFYYEEVETTVIKIPIDPDPDPGPLPSPGPLPDPGPGTTNPDPEPTTEAPEEVEEEEVVVPEFEVTVVPPATPAAPAAVTAPQAQVDIPDIEVPLAAPSANDVQEESEDDGAAAIIIDDPDVPLALIGEAGAWALWNLILSIAGAILALMVGIHALIRKRNDEKDDTEECDVDEEEKRRSRFLFVLAIPILAIIGIILFIFTENMRLQMILADRWTIAHVILFVVAIISYLLAFRNEKRNDDNDKAIRELA